MANQKDRTQIVKQIDNNIASRYGNYITFSEIVRDNPEILERMSPAGLLDTIPSQNASEVFSDVGSYIDYAESFLEGNLESGEEISTQDKVRFWFSQFAEEHLGLEPVYKTAPTPDYSSKTDSINNLRRVALYSENQENGGHMKLLVPASRTIKAGDRNNNKYSTAALANVNKDGSVSIIAVTPTHGSKSNHFNISYIQVPKDRAGNFKVNENGTISIKNPQISVAPKTVSVTPHFEPAFKAYLSVRNELERKKEDARIEKEQKELDDELENEEVAEQLAKDEAWKKDRERKRKTRKVVLPSFEP